MQKEKKRKKKTDGEEEYRKNEMIMIMYYWKNSSKLQCSSLSYSCGFVEVLAVFSLGLSRHFCSTNCAKISVEILEINELMKISGLRLRGVILQRIESKLNRIFFFLDVESKGNSRKMPFVLRCTTVDSLLIAVNYS